MKERQKKWDWFLKLDSLTGLLLFSGIKLNLQMKRRTPKTSEISCNNVLVIGAKWKWINRPSSCNGACSIVVITRINISSSISFFDLWTFNNQLLFLALRLNYGSKI